MTPPQCYLCKSTIPPSEADDYLCRGCGQLICEDCMVNIALDGKHDPKDHLEEEDWDAYDD